MKQKELFEIFASTRREILEGLKAVCLIGFETKQIPPKREASLSRIPQTGGVQDGQGRPESGDG